MTEIELPSEVREILRLVYKSVQVEREARRAVEDAEGELKRRQKIYDVVRGGFEAQCRDAQCRLQALGLEGIQLKAWGDVEVSAELFLRCMERTAVRS